MTARARWRRVGAASVATCEGWALVEFQRSDGLGAWRHVVALVRGRERHEIVEPSSRAARDEAEAMARRLGPKSANGKR